MALPSTYNTGTATINANETAVVGQGTTWLTSGVQPGDLFTAAGLDVRILAVVSNTSMTLAYPWPGASRAAQVYEVRFTPEITRALAAARAVLDVLTNGILYALAGLATAADRLPYFTGAGTAALATFTAFGRSLVGSANASAALTALGAAPIASPTFTGNVTFSGGVLASSDNARVIGSATARFASVYALAIRHCADLYGTDDTSRVIINGGATAAASGSGASGGVVARGPTNAVNPGGVELFTGGSASLTLNNLGVMTVVPSIGAHILPSADVLRDLGSTSARYRQIYTAGASIGSETQNGTFLNLVAVDTADCGIEFRKGGFARWSLRGYANGNFALSRRDAAGVLLDAPFAVSGATGAMTFSAPPVLPSYTVATVPSASVTPRGMVYVSNGTANKRLAISDGTNWRFPDGAIVS